MSEQPMIVVTLTMAQAKYLRAKLDSEESDAHWSGAGPSESREHASTIHRKIDEAIKAKEWR